MGGYAYIYIYKTLVYSITGVLVEILGAMTSHPQLRT